MRVFLLSILFGLTMLFAFPTDSFAAGLVPCNGPDCQTCHFVQLGTNILDWIIGVMATVCAVVIAVAGLKMATAGGDTGAVSSAKEMITNTIIGFIILLAAWLIVDTVMRTFVGDEIPGFGPWNSIQCVAQPTPTPSPTDACATASNPEACRCEAGGGVWNLGTGTCDGGTATTTPTACSVPALTAPHAENGIVWSNPTLQACVSRFIAQVGGSVTSAYRPPEYQTHLWEVHNRWCTRGLQSNTEPGCSSFRSTIQGEMSGHALSCSRPVGQTSNHSSGRAVDISGIAHGSSAVLSAASANCLSWPLGQNDPVHYELRSGCTCN